VLLHLDTDLGGDPDDACALAMLLGWPGGEIRAITTTIDPGGERAACVDHVLGLAGRRDIPVIVGAAASLTRPRDLWRATDDPRYWPPLPPRQRSQGTAAEALARSIDAGATIVAIGPCTNLAILESQRPGTLAGATVVVMGGWVDPPAPGLPPWGPDKDWNVQADTRAAEVVLATAGRLTLVTYPATLGAWVRDRDLPRLRASGPLGRLLARQSEARGADAAMAALGRAHPGLPDDLLNFHYDPVTCAAALGWPGAVTEVRRLRTVVDGGVLRCVADGDGRQMTVVTSVDGDAFAEAWLAAVTAADAGSR
jgi:inosine-uridine nucleoside N-ribohydrolase